MKHEKFLKSFLILALIITFSSHAYASEVIGNLSSSGDASPNPNQTQTGGANKNASLGRTVGRGFASGTSGSSGSTRTPGGSTSSNVSTRSVLGASTSTTYAAPAPEAYAAPVLSAGVGSSDLQAISWFWVILLLLTLIATIIYLYRGNKRSVNIRNP